MTMYGGERGIRTLSYAFFSHATPLNAFLISALKISLALEGITRREDGPMVVTKRIQAAMGLAFDLPPFTATKPSAVTCRVGVHCSNSALYLASV